MRTLIIGANGYVGSAIGRALVSRGHAVAGLARNAASHEALVRANIEPIPGSLRDLAELERIASHVDAVVFVPFIAFSEEPPAIEAIFHALAHTKKPFVYCSGTGSIGIPTPDGEWREETYAEDDAVVPYLWTAKRLGTEQLTLNGACRGVRAMVVRPPMVWGLGGSKQIPSIFYSVRQTGNACYVGKGLNMYSHVHVDDLAELFCLVVDRGTAGHLYHAVAGEVNWRTIAEAVAEVRECHARSVTLSEAQVIWGRVEANIVFATSSRSRAVRSRRELGWQPSRTDLIDDIRHGSYREAFGGADSRRFRELEMYSVSDPKSQG